MAKQRWQKQNLNNRGYMVIHFRFNGLKITKPVHRMVLETFIPIPPEGKTEANHKDGCKANNHIENLEWCSRSENILHKHRVLMVPGSRTKLTPEQRAEILVEYWKLNGTKAFKCELLADQFGVSAKTVECIAYRVGVYCGNRLVT